MNYLIQPWKHQLEAINRARDVNEFGLFFDPGTGKTLTTINILREKCNNEKRLLRTLILCPPIVIPNWRDEWLKNSKIDKKDIILLQGTGTQRLALIEKYGFQETEDMDGRPATLPRGRIFVGNYETLNIKGILPALLRWKPEVLVADECFSAETKIFTLRGHLRIDQVVPGDHVLNCLGWCRVSGVSKKKVTHRVRISYGSEELICSTEHPLFTTYGWLFARELKKGDHLVHPNTSMSILRKEFQERYLPEHSASLQFLHSQLSNELQGPESRISELHKKQQSDEKTQCSGKSFEDSKKNKTQASYKRWKWPWSYKSRTDSFRKITGRLRMELCSFFGTKNSGVPYLLQNRHSFTENKVSRGSGRIEPCCFISEATGQEKRKEIGFIRVGSVEIFQQGDHEFPGSDYFYDLTVEGHPSFTANGVLVHNCHKLKNIKSLRTKQTIELSTLAKYRYILSGSPILNSPLDLFAQFLVLDQGETFGKNFFAFRGRYFYDKNSGMPKQRYFPNWQVLPGALDEINEKIYRKAMRAEKKMCLDLPPYVVKTIKVPMTPRQEALYKSMKKDFIAVFNDKAITATLAITKGLRLQQIASGYVKDIDGEEHQIEEETPKQEALKYLLEELAPNHKVLVWAVWKANYEAIRNVCTGLGLDYVEVHGDIPEKAKHLAVERFNTDDRCRVFIGHPGSGGIGINLVAASYSIFYSRNFSLEHSLQAEARNYRGGSDIHEKITRIDLVTENTIDEIIAEKLAKKEEISYALLRDISLELGK